MQKEVVDKESVPGETWRIYFFHGQASGQLKLEKAEVLDVVYVTKDDLPGLDIAFNHRQMLTQFFDEI